MFHFLTHVVLICLSLGGLARMLNAQTTENQSDLFELLLEQGIRLTPTTVAPLPPPVIPFDQLTGKHQLVLERLAGKQGWEKFARDSVYAPVMIDLESIEDSGGERIGHSIHTAFIAYAALATLRDEELMREIFGPSTGSDEGVADDANLDLEVSFESQEIPPAELVRLGIELSRLGNEQYRTIQLPLLNQVTVRGTVRIAKREQPNGVQIFWHLDPRFANSEMFGNTWTKMERNDLGKAMPTMPASYAGCGGYLAITEIDGERHQILVESRMILHEPKEWFSGSNFLRAKLPPALQENARSFRRRLAK